MNALALCCASDAQHGVSFGASGDCHWTDDDSEDWSVYVVDGVAYTFAGTFVQFIDELEAP